MMKNEGNDLNSEYWGIVDEMSGMVRGAHLHSECEEIWRKKYGKKRFSTYAAFAACWARWKKKRVTDIQVRLKAFNAMDPEVIASIVAMVKAEVLEEINMNS